MSGTNESEVTLLQAIAYAGAMIGSSILILIAGVYDAFLQVAGTFIALMALGAICFIALKRMGWSSRDLPGRFARRLRGSSPEPSPFRARVAAVLVRETKYSWVGWSSRAADWALIALVALELAGLLGGLAAAVKGVFWQTLGLYVALTALGLAGAYVLLRLMLWKSDPESSTDERKSYL